MSKLQDLIQGKEVLTLGDRLYRAKLEYSDDGEAWKESRATIAEVAGENKLNGTLERILSELGEFIEMLESDDEVLTTEEAKSFNKNIIEDLKEIERKYR